jgi:hypothetical protein
MITLPWHPTRATDRAVYHDDTHCPEGAAIAVEHRRPGDGGRPHCELYARGGLGALQSGGLSETDALRCPACQSDRTAPTEHVIVSGRLVVRVERQCAASGAVFWVRADDAPPNAPPK